MSTAVGCTPSISFYLRNPSIFAQRSRARPSGVALSVAVDSNHFRCNPAKEVAGRTIAQARTTRRHAVVPAQQMRAGVRSLRARFASITCSTPGRCREWRPARSQLPRTLWATRLSLAAAVGEHHDCWTAGFRCR
ncbi:unnamed protein product [Leptosia nina]|uniref:Uncharacterized protein n=1 Tax=Leptosia nina TaxID=320188 RepID=A0AAV1K0D2_9NEOP